MISDLKQAGQETDVAFLSTEGDDVDRQDSGVIPFPATEAVGEDDLSIAEAFVQHENEGPKPVVVTGKKTLRQYIDDSGLWRDLDDGGVAAFNNRLCRFVGSHLAATEKPAAVAGRYKSVRRMLFEAVPSCHVSPDAFDRGGTKLALINGVYDLERHELLPHSPDHLLTLGVGYAYEPEGTCPRFERFLGEVLVRRSTPKDETSPLVADPELRLLVQEMMGYCLCTHCKAERGFFLLGHGRNGKSKLLGVIRQLLGEHNVCDGFDLRRLSNPNSNMRLAGKLAALGIEQQQGVLINEAAYKAFVSGEPLPARLLYNDEVSLTPFAKLIVPGNYLPETRDFSLGFWERTVVIPFLNRFIGEAADTELQEKLTAELPGILNFALEGYRRLRDNGWKFTVAEAAIRATEVYRNDSDAMLLWLDDCLRPSATSSRIPVMSLFEHFEAYCTKRRYLPGKYNNFSKRLKLITENRQGEPWGTAAADGTPFSMAYHRLGQSRAYVGNFVLGQCDD